MTKLKLLKHSPHGFSTDDINAEIAAHRTNPTTEPRSISEIAAEIYKDWKHPYFGAVPYLAAMRSLSTMRDNYGADSAESVVSYFLVNAKMWRGDTARRIKAELNGMLKAA